MDMRTLLTTQRVCRTWAHLIRTSTSLQKAFFFLPEHPSTPNQPRVYNPLLAETFSSFFPTHVLVDTLHNLETLNLLFWPVTKTSNALTKFLRPEASWRRMLTSQHPIYRLTQFGKGTGMMCLGWVLRKGETEAGLCMGALFETAMQLHRRYWKSGWIWVNAPSQLEGTGGFRPLGIGSMSSHWRMILGETDLVLARYGVH